AFHPPVSFVISFAAERSPQTASTPFTSSANASALILTPLVIRIPPFLEHCRVHIKHESGLKLGRSDAGRVPAHLASWPYAFPSDFRPPWNQSRPDRNFGPGFGGNLAAARNCGSLRLSDSLLRCLNGRRIWSIGCLRRGLLGRRIFLRV